MKLVEGRGVLRLTGGSAGLDGPRGSGVAARAMRGSAEESRREEEEKERRRGRWRVGPTCQREGERRGCGVNGANRWAMPVSRTARARAEPFAGARRGERAARGRKKVPEAEHWAAGKERGAGRGEEGGPDWFELLGCVWVFYWAGFFSGFLLSFPFSISNTTQIYFEFKRNLNSNPKHSTK